MGFEWDECKRQANIDRHGIDFVRAKEIWQRPVIEIPSSQTHHGEARFIAVGQTEGRVIAVVYTWRKATGGSFRPDERGEMKKKTTTSKLGNVRGDRTDWARVDAITEEELERNIAADPDADPGADWTRARLVIPQRKESVHLRVDPDVLGWFRQQGKGYLTRMNAVLKAYYEAHRSEHR